MSYGPDIHMGNWDTMPGLKVIHLFKRLENVMKRKRIWSASLSAIMALVIMLSYGGVTVLANENDPGNEVTATEEEKPAAETAENDAGDKEPDKAQEPEEEKAPEEAPAEDPAEDPSKAPSEDPAAKADEEEIPDQAEPAKSEDEEVSTGEVTVTDEPKNAVTDSGNCGDNGTNVKWSLEDGVLNITGTGRMSSSWGATDAPWYENHQTEITSIVVGEGVTFIGGYAFYYLYNAKTVSLPSTLTEIGSKAFYGSGITSVTLPDSIEYIYASAFRSCESLKSVVIPDTDKTIKFEECVFLGSGLTSVTIPKNVTTISISLFASCASLETVIIEEGTEATTIEGNAFAQSGITSITIPGRVNYIGDYAFVICKNLKTVRMNKGVRIIDHDAFSGCSSLSSVYIPESISSIGEDAFDGCTNVADIYCYAESGFDWEYDFENTDIFKENKGTKFHVYEEYLADYQSEYSYVNVTFVGDLGAQNKLAKVEGYNLTLSEQIALNYFISVPDTYNGKTLTVEFSWGDGSTDPNTGEPYSFNETGTLTKTEGNVYKTTCAVAARAMNDTITMTLKADGTVILTNNYSVVQYINYLAATNNDYGDSSKRKLLDLLAAMVQYGAASQIYFGYRTDNLVSSAAVINSDAVATVGQFNGSLKKDNLVLPDLAIKKIADRDLGIKYYGAAAVGTTQTRVRLYFSAVSPATISSLKSSIKVTYKGSSIPVKSQTVNGQELLYIEFAGLNPGIMLNPISFTVNGTDYTYQLQDYVGNCIGQSDSKVKNVATALYTYGNYAANYV